MDNNTYEVRTYDPLYTPRQPKSSHLGLKILALILVCITVGAAAGAGLVMALNGRRAEAMTLPPTLTSLNGSTYSQVENGTVTAVYNQVGPAVVRIFSTIKSQSQSNSFSFGFPFDDFFGNGRSAPQTQESQVSGSGFFIDTDGHILTNNHVIDGATSIQVELNDTDTVAATVVGTDPSNDLAVLKIAGGTPSGIAPLTLANSDSVQVGELAIAIGNPFGLERTVTVGVISAKNRSMTADNGRQISDVLQTDAAINPGNSGGPLLNAQGQVVGVNTAIESPTNSFAGIGLAVSSNTIARELNTLLAGQTIGHPWLGISGVEITAAIAKQYSLQANKGVWVAAVTSGGPAEKAGLQPSVNDQGGDIITAVNGKAVTKVADIVTIIDQYKPGTTVTLDVLRSGKRIAVNVVLGEWPDNMPQ
jgi:S1-C subfamily serine protease